MGIFGDDKLQDERIASLEGHVRELTQTVQANQADLVEARIAILKLQAEVDEKISVTDVDPAVVDLNDELGKAREELERSKAAASESWSTLQTGVNEAFDSLRASVQKAYDQVKKAR
jgi:hypothetical protein